MVQAECVQHGLRTIAFCHTRKLCELVTAYTRETLKATAPDLASTISVYRAGYSPQVLPNAHLLKVLQIAARLGVICCPDAYGLVKDD